jgi:hypothetical protein
MMKFNSGMVAAVFLTASVPAFSQSATDVLGVKLGMTLEQAREALKKSGTSFKIIEGRYAAQPGIPESVAFINACASTIEPSDTICTSGVGGAFGSDQVLVAFGQMSGRAFFVSRNWKPPEAEQPFSAAVEKSVLEKYRGLVKAGTSSSNNVPSGRSYSESSDLNGKLKGSCSTAGSPIPNLARSNCGFAAAADFEFKGNVQRLVKMEIRPFDHRVLLADIKKANEIATDNAAKQRSREEDAARKASTPKL